MNWLKNIPSPYDKLLIAVLVVGIAVAGLLALKKFFPQKEIVPASRSFQQLTAEEKRKILEGLTAPTSAPPLSAEEKRIMLKSVSAPDDSLSVPSSPEEKQRILNSLTAPTQ